MKTKSALKKKNSKSAEMLRGLSAYIITFIFIAPFLYLILSSFKTPIDLQAYPPKFFFSPTLQNYIKIFAEINIWPYFFNSLIISIVVTAFALLIGVPAAYAISRYNFKGRTVIANFFLIVQLAPAVAMILPFFILSNNLGLFNTRSGIMIAYLPWTIPYAIWMLRGFIISTPPAIEEAGMIDGCSRFKAFIFLTIPQLASGLLATIIFTFICSWNEFLLAYFLSNTAASQTLPTTVDFFLTYGNYQFGPMFAAAVLGMVPVVLFTFLVRKYYLVALTGGAVKE